MTKLLDFFLTILSSMACSQLTSVLAAIKTLDSPCLQLSTIPFLASASFSFRKSETIKLRRFLLFFDLRVFLKILVLNILDREQGARMRLLVQ